ncbi:MAG: GlsB/YeaQ/YmgE family stress response membrane protein [Clostridia bacterium]|nr:GlsB/YeaQ/YmgE family stress response membrane protein [Clostridia bacterium]
MPPILGIIISILLGALAGWLASLIMKSSHGLLLNIIIGIVGGFLGGWLAGLIGLGGGWLVQFLIAVAGACLLIFLFRLIFGKGKKKR